MKYLSICLIVFCLGSCSNKDSYRSIENDEQNVGKENTSIQNGIISQEVEKINDNSEFNIVQSDTQTSLEYKGKVVHSWSHGSKDNPFIWDEGCDQFTKILDSLNKENGSLLNEQKQKAWESLSKNEQALCIKENLKNTISWKKIDERFYEIRRAFYEGSESGIFDSKNLTYMHGITGTGTVKKIYYSANFISFIVEYGYGDNGDLLMTFDSNFTKKITRDWNKNGTDLITINSVEFIDTSKIKILYKKGFPYDVEHEEKSVIIKIN